jgi:hypothetical protein
MWPLFVALALSIAAQTAAPVVAAASDPALAKARAQVVRAAQRRNFALLLQVLDDPDRAGDCAPRSHHAAAGSRPENLAR